MYVLVTTGKLFISQSKSPRDFRHLANIFNDFSFSFFPLMILPEGTTVISSIPKPKLFAHIFANKSTLDDSGLVPIIKMLCHDVFTTLSGLDPRKA